MSGKEQMLVICDIMSRAVGKHEGEGLEPGGAALGERGEDDAIGACLKLSLNEHDALHGLGRDLESLEEGERLPPSFPRWK
jgi:hypothetical protein